ncbi:hypothetical protein CpB0217 [Chlamydia pneumoniae TW-183]|uniref:Uncharacterized protein n=1 Tax=Chlamydia pneumoniae TaxID=83558 RepID=A0ABN3YPM5_CHLPN|nr:hypothetical protein CpB0217 [Chlamydia pneumoniae TW-183]
MEERERSFLFSVFCFRELRVRLSSLISNSITTYFKRRISRIIELEERFVKKY